MDEVAIREQGGELLARAERALAEVKTSEEAEDLWRRLSAIDHAARLAQTHETVQLKAGRLKLRAERRWGELLPPADEEQERAKDGTYRVTAGNAVHAGETRIAHHRARQVAAVPDDVFETYVERTSDPEMLRRGRLLRIARETSTPPAAAGQVVEIGDVQLRHGDLRESLNDLEGHVDAIITDPPYPAEFLAEYNALGEVAARLLREGGVMAVMVGQTHLPEYLGRLAAHIPYRWCAAYLTDGPATRVFGRRVGTKWKPVLIFGGSRFLTQDVFRSQGADKEHHHWGQSESGMADIVARLTEPGELVCDPFLGGGTTAVVCRDLGRHFVGCDVDAAAITRTTERLSA